MGLRDIMDTIEFAFEFTVSFLVFAATVGLTLLGAWFLTALCFDLIRAVCR